MAGWGDHLPPLVDPPFIPPPSGAMHEGGSGGMHGAFPGFQGGGSAWGAPRDLPPAWATAQLDHDHHAAFPGGWPSSPGPSAALGLSFGGFPASPMTPHWGLSAGGGGGDPIGQSFFSTPNLLESPHSASPWHPAAASPMWGGATFSRSHSYGGHQSPYMPRRRNSFGGGTWQNAYGHSDDAYHSKNLARRPRDWRPDYTPRGGLFSAMLGTIGRDRSDVKEYRDHVKRDIHHSLVNSKSHPRLYVHLPDPASVAFPEQGRQANELDLMQLACTPSAPGLRIMHESLPWYLDIVATHPNGVTIGDLLHQICASLMQPISARHYWNESLSDGDRANIAAVFNARCQNDMEQIKMGIRKVDFMGSDCILKGFVRRSGGVWEMITTAPSR
ncbi:hypothetical protein HGRIS_013932 [Hohenbuehelia grisea]|uniref:DUF6699 domain-containing protein n=1 Tax=Hohenbuehelia grisea TaxID=104357 RepID=A0ABR3JS35_9AGAR